MKSGDETTNESGTPKGFNVTKTFVVEPFPGSSFIAIRIHRLHRWLLTLNPFRIFETNK